MENLTAVELQALYVGLRGELVRKKGTEKAILKKDLNSFYKNLEELNNKMNEVREQADKRGLKLS